MHRNPGRSGKIRQGEEEGGREVRSLDWEGEMGNGLRAALRWLLLPLLFFFKFFFIYLFVPFCARR
jgi:hypothetical protein